VHAHWTQAGHRIRFDWGPAGADAASVAGGEVLSASQSGPIDARGLRIWWVDGVATVSDGESLLADDSTVAADAGIGAGADRSERGRAGWLV